MSCFVNKVVVVTGASSGIGKTTAEEFSKRHAKVVIVGRNIDNLREVEESCKRNGANEVFQIVAEFENLPEVDKVVEDTIARFGGIDILVNNAGCAKLTELESVRMEDFDWMFSINVKSMLRLTQRAMPHLVKSKGCVVNVSSIFSRNQNPSALIYCMTKSVVDQFTKTIALEYAPKGVRVNSVNPANVETNITRHTGMSEEVVRKHYADAAAATPLGRIGTTMEVASAILYLASNDSAWTTGQCFFLDGGQSLK